MAFFSSFLTEKQDGYDSPQSYAADSLHAVASEELSRLTKGEHQDFYDFTAEYVQYHLDERQRASKPAEEFLSTDRPAQKINSHSTL